MKPGDIEDPLAAQAECMAAGSTMAGTPVKSCMITRAG